MLESVYFPLMFLTAVVGVGTAMFALAYRGRAGAKPLAVFAVGASLWAIVEGLRVAQSGIETMELWTSVALSLSAVIPPAWLVFVVEYTGNERRLPNWLFPALLIEPAIFWGLIWTNSDHRLVWDGTERISYGTFEVLNIEFGLAFWGHQVYAYLLFALGALVLVRMLLRTNQLYRWQGTTLLIAITLPLTLNALYSFEFLPSGIDPSGVGYVLAALLLAVAVFEAELEGVAPATRELGREAALTELDDAIVILNDGDRIVDANPAGERLLGSPVEELLGQEIGTVVAPLADLSKIGGTQIELEREGKRRFYDVRVSTLSEEYGMVSGRVVSLRDVSDRRQREQRLDVLNRMLRHNIRNELNLVRGKIDLAQTNVDHEDATDHLRDATTAVDGIVARSDKLGRLSQMLDSDQRDQIDIAGELRRERETGGLQFEGGTVTTYLPEKLVVSGGSALVAAFEELLSNAIEHNDNPKPRASVRLDDSETDDEHVLIEVSDNGSGIEQQEFETILSGRETALQHSSGVGLWLVNWVVGRAGGSLAFENDDGCTVRVRLPRA